MILERNNKINFINKLYVEMRRLRQFKFLKIIFHINYTLKQYSQIRYSIFVVKQPIISEVFKDFFYFFKQYFERQNCFNKLRSINSVNPQYQIVTILGAQMEKMQSNIGDKGEQFPLFQMQLSDEGISHQSANHLDLLEEHKNINNILQIKKNKTKIIQNKSKCRKQKKVIEENPNLKKGHWTHEQNKRYHWFLQVYNQHFVKKHLRRMDKIFKTMATFIGTREAEQCRSHHQKMQKKYHTFYKIIANLRQQFFQTLSPQQLIIELKEKQITIFNKIIQADEIMYQDKPALQIEIQSHHPLLFSQIKHDQSQLMRSPHDNFFGDEYELNLPFNYQ